MYEESDKTKGGSGRTSYLMGTVLEALGRRKEAMDMKLVAAEIRKDVLGKEPEQDDNQASYDLLIPFEQR
ncbi:hypothetical protein CC86DRAFT_372320 [Ophiobolus disseminans]|uniref:Uncharacterized protein n=1 Tax=Ophiobolus disseminans TaxID=1469910 RepID=A0A6A6ZS99_9PLEO|nr:hypothetical protein CC86DRAFT_372320 [Ophiobolus disseminans]